MSSQRPSEAHENPPAQPETHSPARPDCPTYIVVVSALLCAVLLGFATWASYWAENRHDQYQLILLGRCIHEGGSLYVDCWENKPPGIAWINALGILLGGGDQLGAWVLPGVAAALSLAMFGWAVARWVGRTSACVAAVLGAALLSLRTFDTPSVNPDFYAACFELPAAALFVLAIRPAAGGAGRTWLALASGVAWGLAGSVKQVGCVGLLAASLGSVGLAFASPEIRRCWRRGLLLAWVGFAATLLVVGTVLLRQGVLSEAWTAVVTFNRSLLNEQSLGAALRSWSRVTSDLGPMALPLWLGASALVLTLADREARRDAMPFAIMMVAWILIAGAFALVGPSRAMRYWISLFPPLLILVCVSVRGMVETVQATRAEPRVLLVVMLATVGLVLGRPWAEELRFGFAAARADRIKQPTEREELALIGGRVASLVGQDHRIYVWAYRPGVYLYANRLPACGYTYPRSVAQMEAILSALETRPPGAMIMPVGRSAEFDLWCGEECRVRLEKVMAGYVPAGEVAGWRILVEEALQERSSL